jgi:hypothetical protein
MQHTLQKTYPPANRCIYCGDTNGPLGEEHIIPEGIGGRIILPRASCKECERKIGKVEGTLNNADFAAARAHLGIKSKNSGRARNRIRLDLAEGLEKIRDGAKVSRHPLKITNHYITKEEHPSLMMLPAFDPPGILLRQPPTDEFCGDGVFFWSITEGAGYKLAKVGPQALRMRTHFELFGRLIAKIGYASAVADLGYGAFDPFVLDIILEGNMFAFKRYVGGHGITPPSDFTHDVAIMTGNLDGKNLVCADIRLFSTRESAVGFRVFVGEMK